MLIPDSRVSTLLVRVGIQIDRPKAEARPN